MYWTTEGAVSISSCTSHVIATSINLSRAPTFTWIVRINWATKMNNAIISEWKDTLLSWTWTTYCYTSWNEIIKNSLTGLMQWRMHMYRQSPIFLEKIWKRSLVTFYLIWDRMVTGCLKRIEKINICIKWTKLCISY